MRAARARPERASGSGCGIRCVACAGARLLKLPESLLATLDIDAETELELSTDGDVLVVTPIREDRRKRDVAELVAEAHEQYGGVFRRLAK